MKVRLYRRCTYPHNSKPSLIKKLKLLRSDGVKYVDLKLSDNQKAEIEKCHLFAITPWIYSVDINEVNYINKIQRHKILRAIFNAYLEEKKHLIISKDLYGKEDFQLLNDYGFNYHIVKYRIFL